MKRSGGRIDAVVCARNERRTIRRVVRVLRKSPNVCRVFVVDDCSSDGTGWRARLAGATVVTGPGLGKSAAMRAGLAKAGTFQVLFVDGDIRGFTREHVDGLTSGGLHEMRAGLRDNGSKWLGPVPPVSGERCCVTEVARMALAGARGYEAETAINAAYGRLGLPVRTVKLAGLKNPRRAPLARTGQVLAAASRHVLGLVQYMVSWLVTAIGVLLWS